MKAIAEYKANHAGKPPPESRYYVILTEILPFLFAPKHAKVANILDGSWVYLVMIVLLLFTFMRLKDDEWMGRRSDLISATIE